MKTIEAGLAAFLVLFAVGARAATKAQRTVEGWPEANKQAALAMIDKYGQPDSTIGDRLEWDNRGQYKRIVVDGHAPSNLMVENTVAYAAPRHAGLVNLDAIVKPDVDKGELTSCGRSETANKAALNLSDDVMHGRKSADQARQEWTQTSKLEKSGKTSAISERLQFQPGIDPLYNYVNTAPY